ncbi:MAG: anti-sigma factor domain-containing protein, partial [Actinobacteria bacterium]|nr:anti-sigma factor domain-containing protein [Actinomycetota bacterium]
MIYAQAVIVEINRNYSIVMTPDGQFLKQDIPAGKYEIGDTVIVSLTEENKKGENAFVFRLASRIAVGFAACAIIALGSYFGIQYLQPESNTFTARMEENGDKVIVQANVEQNYSETLIAGESETDIAEDAGEQKMLTDLPENETVESDLSPEAGQVQEKMLSPEIESMPVLYEGNYNLDELNTAFAIDYEDIKIDYHVGDAIVPEDSRQTGKSLFFNFIQNKK